MIEIENIFFSYGDLPLFQDLSLSIAKGERILIIGPNGGGKSTFLKLLLGFLSPQKGQIKMPKDLRIGYVPQHLIYDRAFPITLREVVRLGLLRHLTTLGRYPSWCDARVEEVLAEMELLHLADQSFGTLSGGQARRGLLAAGIVDDPDVLILDEPMAGLDPKACRDFYDKLARWPKEKTLLHVTHELLPELIKDSSRILCIQKAISEIPKSRLCEHYLLGLYHPEGEKA